MRHFPFLTICAALLLFTGCKKKDETAAPPNGQPAAKAPLKIGLVLDVGGRGDGSFNDSALRGVELWAAGVKMQGQQYSDAAPAEVQASLSEGLRSRQPAIEKLNVKPVVLSSKAAEDYEPNLDLLVQQGSGLTIGVGFLLENAVEAVARRTPEAKFLLIDSPLLDSQGKRIALPNVRTIIFREEEGSFLVGALAGLLTKTGTVGFVGGMEVPLIKRFETGFRAGLATTNPEAAKKALITYTGSFDNVAAGKQVASDLLAKNADIIFHAAGSDGLGVIQAVKEAKAAGKAVWVVGVDSDQSHLAPDAVLTSMVKRVDLAVYDTVRASSEGRFEAGDVTLGLRQQGVELAPIRVEFEGKDAALTKIEALKLKVAAGEIKVPSTTQDLAAFKAPL